MLRCTEDLELLMYWYGLNFQELVTVSDEDYHKLLNTLPIYKSIIAQRERDLKIKGLLDD